MKKYTRRIAIGFALLVSISTIEGTELTDIWALGQPGLQAEQQKDYANARRNFDAAVQLHPKNPVPYAHRGLFFFKHDQYALAAKDFDTALSLHRTVLEYQQWRGITYARLGRYDFALADFSHLLSMHNLYPGDQTRADILNERAWILATCPDARYRNGKQAIEDATSAANTGGYRKASYLDTLAAAYAETGDFESAIKYEQKAIAARTKSDKLTNAEGALNIYRQHKPFRSHPGKEG
jgi:tetratricopeptide (TPR) repeat protein